jgi:hypothetical protein
VEQLGLWISKKKSSKNWVMEGKVPHAAFALVVIAPGWLSTKMESTPGTRSLTAIKSKKVTSRQRW